MELKLTGFFFFLSNARMLELELRRLLIIFVGQIIKISLSLKGRIPADKAHLSTFFWTGTRDIRTPLLVSSWGSPGLRTLSEHHVMCQEISNARLKGKIFFK